MPAASQPSCAFTSTAVLALCLPHQRLDVRFQICDLLFSTADFWLEIATAFQFTMLIAVPEPSAVTGWYIILCAHFYIYIYK